MNKLSPSSPCLFLPLCSPLQPPHTKPSQLTAVPMEEQKGRMEVEQDDKGTLPTLLIPK